MVLDSNNLITYEAYEYGKKEPVGAKAGAVSLNGVEWELGQSGMNSLKMLMCVVNLI